jgi:isochorismate hydrolase
MRIVHADVAILSGQILGHACHRWNFQAITGAVNRLDILRMPGVGFELGAQVAHMDANRLDIVIRIVAPDLLEDFAGRDGLAMALQQAASRCGQTKSLQTVPAPR